MRIDFDRYIAERTEDYSPRPWLFEKIGAWLAAPGTSRYCLVTSEPGGGKTAVAGQVCNASRGRLGEHDLPIPAGAIDAYHFCFSQDAAWIDPLEFSHSISSQLAESVPGFEAALLDTQPEMEHVTAAPKVTTGDVAPGGSVTGVTVNVKLGSAQATFIREVRNPLVRLYEQGLDRDVVILVDALDEARLTVEKDATILDLIASLKQSLPRVRFLLTSRPEIEIRRVLERQDPHLVTFELGGEAREKSRRDVQRYVSTALPKSAAITANLGLPLAALEEQLAMKADGNFLWARFALGMLEKATQPITAATLDALPSGLGALYLEFIERVARKDPARWSSQHALVLGTLVAAQEEMSAEEIARFSGLDDARVAAVILDIGQLFDVDPETGKYALYHRSFSDFLVDRRAAQGTTLDVDQGALHPCWLALSVRRLATALGLV